MGTRVKATRCTGELYLLKLVVGGHETILQLAKPRHLVEGLRKVANPYVIDLLKVEYWTRLEMNRVVSGYLTHHDSRSMTQAATALNFSI